MARTATGVSTNPEAAYDASVATEKPDAIGGFETLKSYIPNGVMTIENNIAFLNLAECDKDGDILTVHCVSLKSLAGLTNHQCDRLVDLIDPAGAELRKAVRKAREKGLTDEQIKAAL